MLPPGAIIELKIHQDAFAAGALPRTSLGDLTALPTPLAGFLWVTSRQGRRGKGKGGKWKWKGGECSPLLFLQFND